ncbi:MAG: bifunctional 5,10-methylenetetrahydrofolate dehydrogenase/5,10-methenyltetrahydrofolate cyclohydrolase [Candidatus Omnitrophota bacterium]
MKQINLSGGLEEMGDKFKPEESYDSLRNQIKSNIKSLPQLCLASFVFGSDGAARRYLSAQKQMADEFGVRYKTVEIDSDASYDYFSEKLRELNNDKSINGIILNKPFPQKMPESMMFSLISQEKDIEGLSPLNMGKLCYTSKQIILPPDSFSQGDGFCFSPTALSVLYLLNRILLQNDSQLTGKRVVIIGFSSLIGKPLSLFLGDEISTVTIANIETYNKGDLPFYVSLADILISAAGKPHLIKGDWIKKGAVVIDVSTSVLNGNITGDADYDSIKDKVSYFVSSAIVGKFTTLFLYHNLAILSRKQL